MTSRWKGRLFVFPVSSPSEAQRKRVREESEEQGSERSFWREPEAVAGNGVERTLRRARSSWKERKGNALASGADEGRDKLR